MSGSSTCDGGGGGALGPGQHRQTPPDFGSATALRFEDSEGAHEQEPCHNEKDRRNRIARSPTVNDFSLLRLFSATGWVEAVSTWIYMA